MCLKTTYILLITEHYLNYLKAIASCLESRVKYGLNLINLPWAFEEIC